MKTRRWCRLTFMLLTLLAGGGCATQALWDGHLNASNQPAPKSNLHLYQDQRRQDVLVVYTEYSERRDATRTRAYLLKENERRLEHGERPRFVSVKQAQGLPEVPVVLGTNAPAGNLYATVAADGLNFKLSNESAVSPVHALPAYDDGQGRLECAALTPFAVGADLTVVAAYAAYYYAECGGDFDFGCHHR